MFCPGFRPSATSNSVASAACSQMLGTSARSAAVKFSSTYAAGSLRPADGRCRCAPAESRRCPRDDTADFKPRWYTDPFTTPPTPEVQRSRRKRDRRAYGRELTRSYQPARDDKLGFTVTRVARQSSVGDWTRFWEPLRDKLRGVHERFIKLRQDAGAPPGISAIRVLDILLWMAFPKNPRFH